MHIQWLQKKTGKARHGLIKSVIKEKIVIRDVSGLLRSIIGTFHPFQVIVRYIKSCMQLTIHNEFKVVQSCIYHHNQDMKHFHNAKYPRASFNLVFLQPNHGNHSSFAFSRMACKWNHAVCSLLSLTSFTKYNECEFCPYFCILISFYC